MLMFYNKIGIINKLSLSKIIESIILNSNLLITNLIFIHKHAKNEANKPDIVYLELKFTVKLGYNRQVRTLNIISPK